MKQLWNGFKIAFSMYSKIPMPKSDWTDENMRYAMCFFPLVGGVIGSITMGCFLLFQRIGLSGTNFSAILLLLIPVAVTGGIHVDGLIDTADALSSYQPMEKRLEILKDPRTGAFGVIWAVLYFLFFFGIYSLADSLKPLTAERLFWAISLVFVISRALSGYAIVTFEKAKNTGLAASFSDGAKKRAVQIVMVLYLVIAGILLVDINITYAAGGLITALVVFFYYKHMAKEKFGGITGDLAGWFLQICELSMILVMTLLGRFC